MTGVVWANEPARALFREAADAGGEARVMANWVLGGVMRRINDGGALQDSGVSGGSLVELQSLVDEGRISLAIAKKVFGTIWERGGHAADIVESEGLATVGDDQLIRDIVLKAIVDNPKQVEKFKNGNTKLVGFFIGQVMRGTQGRADPGLARTIVVEELSNVPGDPAR